MANVTDTMKRWRRDYDLTQADAAQLLSVSATTYGRWERDAAKIPYRERQRLVATMNAMDHAARLALDGIVGWDQVGGS